MVKKRRTLWVSPESIERIVKLQGRYQEMSGMKVSIQDVADMVIRQISLDNIEIQKRIEQTIQGNKLAIKFDKRYV